jgi:DNA processing protein
MKYSSAVYQIGLTLLPGIGPVRAKLLLSQFGSAESIFSESLTSLKKVPEIGEFFARVIKSADILNRAQEEFDFVNKHDINIHFHNEPGFPSRLKLCDDSPVLLFSKGKLDLNAPRVISIVGTRSATSYGKHFCEELLKGIAQYEPLVVSGLAYGIDICAHRNAMAAGLPTVACLAHGLDKIYPQLHFPVAVEMMNHGGLLTEFVSYTKQAPELFPMRNRIIAGLADCTIVLETDRKGGSIITANIAASYGREVFALPGRYTDRHSSGCNELIKRNQAAILTSPLDLVEYLNWDQKENLNRQLPLFDDLNEQELSILRILSDSGRISIDQIGQKCELELTTMSSILLELEFKGKVKSLPGKIYQSI